MSAKRFEPIDALRGLVMVIMAVDHASEELNGGRRITDSALFWTPGTSLEADQFLTRWVTHLCAPTFVVLAGTALAISTTRRAAKGEPAASIDRNVFLRGLLLVAIEVVWMSFCMRKPGFFLFQVMYALGMSFVCMTLLRRLSARVLVALGAALVFGVEPLLDAFARAGVRMTLPVALTIGGGFFGMTEEGPRLIVAYPFVPWLALMCLGWGLGRWLVDARPSDGRVARFLVLFAAACLLIFGLLRWANGYGNAGLHREGAGLVQWLHVSKYPPSVTFVGLEVGLGALLLAFFFATAETPSLRRLLGPIRVLGATALFFYVIHIHLLKLVAWATGWEHRFGVASAWIGGFAVVLALFPACAWYRGYKARNPEGIARWI